MELLLENSIWVKAFLYFLQVWACKQHQDCNSPQSWQIFRSHEMIKFCKSLKICWNHKYVLNVWNSITILVQLLSQNMRAINSFKYALRADVFGTHMIAMILVSTLTLCFIFNLRMRNIFSRYSCLTWTASISNNTDCAYSTGISVLVSNPSFLLTQHASLSYVDFLHIY